MKKTGAAVGIIPALAVASLSRNVAYADGPFGFSPFSSPAASHPSPLSNLPQPTSAAADGESKVSGKERKGLRNDQLRTTSAGFDPEALELALEILNEISDLPMLNMYVCLISMSVVLFVFD